MSAASDRPTCACCGKRYGARVTETTHQFIPVNPAAPEVPPIAPPYLGNGIVERESYSPDAAHFATGDRAYGAPPRYTFTQGKTLREQLGPPGRTVTRVIVTPGEYRAPYRPFCTLRCARSFANAAHRAGYRIVKEEASK